VVEILRMPFEHGEPAGPLRLSARAALTPEHPPDYVEDILLVISELVQNVTQHTAGAGILGLSWDAETVTVEVRDGDRRPPRPQQPAADRPGGRGLLLVAGIATNWGVAVHDDGKTVWARFTNPETAITAAPQA
jgi:two-component sensor histidine kinase